MNEDADFLEYCQLVGDAFVHCPDDVPDADRKLKPDNSILEKLNARASQFVNRVGARRAGGNTFNGKLSAPEFKARLYVCTELAKWMYQQTRLLHSNIVLDERRIDKGGAVQEFAIPYYTHGAKGPTRIPRLAPSLGFVPLRRNSYQFPDFFPEVKVAKRRAPDLLDAHFMHAYLFLLVGLGSGGVFENRISQAVANAYARHWKKDRKSMLKKVLGIEAVRDNKNVFGADPIEVPEVTAPRFDNGVSERRKLYLSLISAFDQWLNALGNWWVGTQWQFDQWATFSSDVEQRLNIVFREEAEILWELLQFYSAALNGTLDDNVDQLLELFWISKKNNGKRNITERGRNLLTWAKINNKISEETVQALIGSIPQKGANRDVSGRIGASRLIIPIHALLMALPPPKGVYRCEIAFQAINDADKHAVIKSAWCFASINMPELLRDPRNAKALLEKPVGKQKVLVSLMVDPVSRARFKEAYRDTIISYGRAALRSAVSAIMGRNMSHNIGSHVLARYASKIKGEAVRGDNNKADHRGEFLAYLQRRMDFLAETATSDKAFWSQPLSLKEQLGRLNYQEQQGRLASGANPIILSHISGKESLLASVEYGLPDEACRSGNGYFSGKEDEDIWFSCPGGEVGVHALFVILENIIRNSSRHGSGGGAAADGKTETIHVFVHADHNEGGSELFKLEILDPRTKLETDGRLRKNGMNEDQKKSDAARAATEEQQLVCSDRHSIVDMNGKRKRLICLPMEINSFLHDEPFLDPSGNPNPQFWGLREMQICAHYLRGFPLSGLEGRLDGTHPVLEADCHKLPDGSHCLKYTLYLQRAKLMTVVTDELGEWDRNILRQKGIVVLKGPDIEKGVGWLQIAQAARGYAFMVVDDRIDIPEDRSVRASLPVRTFECANDDISRVIKNACDGQDWMESLHEHWADLCKNQKKGWKIKPLYGIALWANQAPNIGSPTEPPAKGGLFWVQRESNGNLAPLPETLEVWHAKLESTVIAAAWVEHAGADDFNEVVCARLGHAAVLPKTNGNQNEADRVWISAEVAFSDSPHAAFLCGCRVGSGWELLAAAVPRVVVLDERVQSERTRNVRNMHLEKLWPLMGVWAPGKPSNQDAGEENGGVRGCDLDAPDFGKIKGFLTKPAQRADQYPIDFLVIHLTILERLSKETGNTLQETLNTLKGGTEAETAEIIVVTGRGVPSMARRLSDDRMDTVRYLPISALLESLVARPSKLALMRVLWSAGRPDESSNQ